MAESEAFETLELHPAYVWDCGNCGRENTQRAISYVLDPRKEEDAEVIADMHGPEAVSEMLDALDDGEEPARGVRAISTPNHVVCRHCERQYKASMGGKLAPDDDEDDGDSEMGDDGE